MLKQIATRVWLAATLAGCALVVLAKDAPPATTTTPTTAPSAATALTPEATASPKPSTPSAVPANSARSFIWEIKSKTSQAYLFGTVHVGNAGFYPLPSHVQRAFGASDKLVVEADVTNQQAIGAAMPLVTYAKPDSLETQLPPPLQERLKAQLVKYELPFDALKSIKPFMVAGLLVVTEFGRQGFDPKFGLDGHLIERAILSGKPVVEIEGIEMQMRLLGGLPKDEQEIFLENALTTLEQGRSASQIGAMIAAWRAGDAERLEAVVKEANTGLKDTTALDEKLLYARNVAMAAKIEGYLSAKEKHFVAVGAMHLVGQRGLIALLKAKGFEVRQL